MPSATLALAFLVAGYIFVYRLILTRFVIARASGHPQYFLAAAGGAIIFALAVFIAHIPHASFSDPASYAGLVKVFLPYFGKTFSPERRSFLQVQSACVAGIICFVLPAIFNIPLRTNTRLAKFILSKYEAIGPLEMMLDRCLRRKHPVMLTQDNGKVYVGWVMSGTYEEAGWIKILPVFSGYRDESQKFIITTDYTWIEDLDQSKGREVNEDGTFRDDFAILVKLDTVISVHGYDLKTGASRNFEHDAEPLADRERVVSASVEETKSPSAAKVVLPDWYHPPMAWEPPSSEEYERFVNSVRFNNRYPGGRVYRWWNFTIAFQRYAYFSYGFFVVILPLLAACDTLASVKLCTLGILITLFSTIRPSAHM